MFTVDMQFPFYVYPNSSNKLDGTEFFIGLEKGEKFLYICGTGEGPSRNFEGEVVGKSFRSRDFEVKKCPLNHHNALNIQKLFPFTRPVLIGRESSFGFGDRLGLANPGHIRSLVGFNFKPVLAQQSIRELTRTRRTPDNVLDAAVWAVFQEGYRDGFGADADHLKTTEDIDLMVDAGYTMFTIDPSDHVVMGVNGMKSADLFKKVRDLSWKELGDSYSNMVARYEGKTLMVSNSYSIEPSSREIAEACLKYVEAVVHIKMMHDHLKAKKNESEIEISIDESDTVTTPFEHFFIVNELRRMNVEFVSLAPRFIGGFEKGVDYKGDIRVFKNEYLKHLAISDHFGSYKISFHSGSDKFSVYKAVASIGRGTIHIKTAGASYLEALKVIAIVEPNLFKEILTFSVRVYEEEKKSYKVSADPDRVKDVDELNDNELEGLFLSDDVRQILHVAYGRVLTERDGNSHFIFRDRIFKCLNQNENLHYALLANRFKQHMMPFAKMR